MIFVSLNERYARIIADDGIAATCAQGGMAERRRLLSSSTCGDGDIADGFVAAIERCGAILAEKAPPTGGQDDLPDRLYVI